MPIYLISLFTKTNSHTVGTVTGTVPGGVDNSEGHIAASLESKLGIVTWKSNVVKIRYLFIKSNVTSLKRTGTR